MSNALAVGVPHPLGNGGFDLTPVIAILLVIFLARAVLRVRLTTPVLGLCLLAGTAVSFGADAWGLPVAALAAMLLALVVSALVRFPRRP